MSATFIYTADQAMDDGMLFDVSQMASEAGFKSPVRITVGVKNIVTPTKSAKKYGQSYEGRLWDVLTLAFNAINKSNENEKMYLTFEVIFQDGPRIKQTVKLFAALDFTTVPAIHIGLPSEY